MRSRRTELAQFSREVRNNLLDFLGLFGGEPLCPTAGELVTAGNNRTGEVTQKTVTDVVGTTNQPLVDEAVLRTRRTDGHVNVVRHDAVRQNRGLRAIKLLLQIVVNFGVFAREAQRLGMTRSLPLLVLDRMAFAAAFRTDVTVREVQHGLRSQAVLGSTRTAAGKLRIGLSITFRQEFRTTSRNLVHTLDGAFFSVLKHRVILEKVVPHFLFLDDVVLERTDAHFLFSRRRIVPNLLRNGIHGLGAEARARRGSLYTRRNQSSGAKQRCSRRFDHFCCHLNLLNLF